MRLNELLNLTAPQRVLELTSGKYLSDSDKSSVLQKITEVLQKQDSLQTLVIRDIDADETKAVYEGIVNISMLSEIVLVDVHGEILDCLTPFFNKEKFTITIDHIDLVDLGNQKYANTTILVKLLSAEHSQCNIKLRNLNEGSIVILTAAIAQGSIKEERIIQDFEQPYSKEFFNRTLEMANVFIKMDTGLSGGEDSLTHSPSYSDEEGATPPLNRQHDKRGKGPKDRKRGEIKQLRMQQNENNQEFAAQTNLLSTAAKPKSPAASAAASSTPIGSIASNPLNMKWCGRYIPGQKESKPAASSLNPPMNDDEKRAAIKKLFIQALNNYLKENPNTPIDTKYYQNNRNSLLFSIPIFTGASHDPIERKKEIIKLMNSALLFNTHIVLDPNEPTDKLYLSRGRLSNIYIKLKYELDQTLVDANNKALREQLAANAAASSGANILQNTPAVSAASSMEVDSSSSVAKPAVTPALSNATALGSFGLHKAAPKNVPNNYLQDLRAAYQNLHDANEKRRQEVEALKVEQDKGEKLKKDIEAAERRSVDLRRENAELKKRLGIDDILSATAPSPYR